MTHEEAIINLESIIDCMKGDERWTDAEFITIDMAIEALKAQKTGRWIPVGYDGYADGNPVIDEWECSNCGDEHYGDDQTLTAFCPCCGCEMTEEIENE